MMVDLKAAYAASRKKYLVPSKNTGDTGDAGDSAEKPYNIKRFGVTPAGTQDSDTRVPRVTCTKAGVPQIQQQKQLVNPPVTRVTPGTPKKTGVCRVVKLRDTADRIQRHSVASLRAGVEGFVAIWAAKAKRLGWTDEVLFGLHPSGRVDRRGLAFLLHAGDRVVALDETGADIRTASGAKQRFYRRPVGSK